MLIGKFFLFVLILFLAGLTDLPLYGSEETMNRERIWDSLEGVGYFQGAFIGDGTQGAMVMDCFEEPGGIKLVTSHYQAIAHYTIPQWEYCDSRVFTGDILLVPLGKALKRTMKLDLNRGMVSGEIRTDLGTIEWLVWLDRETGVYVLQVDTTGGETGCLMETRPRWAITPRILLEKKDSGRYEAHLPPKPELGWQEGIKLIANPMKTRGAHVMASRLLQAGKNSRNLLVALGVSDLSPAAQAVTQARQAALDTLRTWDLKKVEAQSLSHAAWWSDYMALSSINLPDDPWWETFWHLQMYKFGAASSGKSSFLIDTQGPWLWETAWAAVWWNLNVQLSYFPQYSGNRLEAGKSLINGIDRLYASGVLHRNGQGKGIHVGRSTTWEGRGDWGSEWGNMPWALHGYWNHWQYSQDEETGRKLFALLKDCALFQASVLEQGEDGLLHMAPGRSPEYSDRLEPDTNYALMSARWVFATLLDMNESLGMGDPQAGEWKEILAKLAPFPVDEHGFKVSPDQGFDEGHRHYSHLLAIYPYHLLDPHSSPETAALLRKSVDRWVSLTRNQGAAGYTWTGACAMYATLGEGNKALDALNRLKRMVKPNTMYAEGGGTVIETPLSAVESINYLLLQSWGGVIRVFPALPTKWKNAGFTDLRAQGAFLVTAASESGMTRNLEIKSLAGRTCRLESPWPGKNIEIRDADGVLVPSLEKDGIHEFKTLPGKRYVIKPIIGN